MTPNYYFVDGSALLAQIRFLQKKDKLFIGRKLDAVKFLTNLALNSRDLESEVYKRAVFYFPTGGEAELKELILIPDFKKPGLVRDVHFKYCGEKLKGTDAFKKFVKENVPEKWMHFVSKSEKGIDIEICCDALRLAAIGKIDRLFLLTNDSDFIPLCRTLKDFGVNVSLVHLSDIKPPNQSLLEHCDSYDVIKRESLNSIFTPQLSGST